MYKPRTIEQFKIMEYIKDNFHMECLLVAPVSRSSLMIQDEIGDRMAFQWMDGHVLEAPLPTPASNQEHLAFIKAFWADPRHPQFMSFDDLTTWWLNNPTPLTHQQILNLPDDLYCRYLECEQLLELDDVLTMVMKERITQTEYQDIRLWFLNGHNSGNWLGLVGVDGDGDRYDLVFNYGIRPSLPEFQAGVIKVMSPYHVEEEELVLWSLFSAQCLLRHEAQERALELFDRYQHRWGDDRVGGETPAEHENARCRENQNEKGKTQRKGT